MAFLSITVALFIIILFYLRYEEIKNIITTAKIKSINSGIFTIESTETNSLSNDGALYSNKIYTNNLKNNSNLFIKEAEIK